MPLYTAVEQIEARLPELEWKLSVLSATINPALLPQGLFRNRFELTSQSCVDEIKADLNTIKKTNNERSVNYLVERVGQKIHVLVRICQQSASIKAPERQVHFGVKAISTRQQWLQSLHDEMNVLFALQKQLTATLKTLQVENNIQAILNLQVELGKVECRLTLMKEKINCNGD